MNIQKLSQYRYKNEAATSLPNSNELAIIITDSSAPANSLDNPNTEKKAALNAISKAESPTRFEKFLLCSNIIVPL